MGHTLLFGQYQESSGFSLAINYYAGPGTIEKLPESWGVEQFDIRQGIRGEVLRSWALNRRWALVTGATLNWYNYQSNLGAFGGFVLPDRRDVRQVVMGIPILVEFAAGEEVQFRLRTGVEPAAMLLNQSRRANTNQSYEERKNTGFLAGLSGLASGQVWVRTTNSTAWFFQVGGQWQGMWSTGDGQKEWNRYWHIGTGVQWTWE